MNPNFQKKFRNFFSANAQKISMRKRQEFRNTNFLLALTNHYD